MSMIPLPMRRNGRHPVPHFLADEYLYRRVPDWMWENAADPLEVNAIELPDLSLGRSKFGHPEWVRLDPASGNYFKEYGVIGFRVGDVPPERWNLGSFRFTFKTVHVPEEMNYPHSEIQTFEDGKHVDLLEKLPEEIHLEWRELLLRKTVVFLKPHQGAKIRSN